MTSRELTISNPVTRRLQVVAAAGVLTFIAGAFLAADRAWTMLLLVSIYAVGVALGGAVFVALHYVTGASWSIRIRRVPEALAATTALGGAGVLAVLVLHPSIYPWAHASLLAAMPWFRRGWLSAPFLIGRAVLFIGGWILFTRSMIGHSRAQDSDGDPMKRVRNTTLSTAFLVFFAISVWLASFDWIMSLEPEWASTIFGMYNFAGLFVSALAVTTIVTVWLRDSGAISLRRDQLHDLGKMMFAFSTFWMYLWFSQYMLIWYANIADETVYYVRRTQSFWGPLFVLNLALNWVIPFFALLPRANKQNPALLMKVALVLLAGRWLDLYLMIAPPVVGATPRIGIWEIGITAGMSAGFALLLFAALRRAPLTPQKDEVPAVVATAALAARH